MLIIVHLSLMIAAALCLITGVGIAMFGRKNKFWLKWHKSLNSAGFCLMIAGAVMAFTAVATSDGDHLDGLHQWMGLTTFILTGISVFLGFYSFKAANKPAVRAAHRWSGRLSVIAILATLPLGLILIGIL
jgi:hypothetical protein